MIQYLKKVYLILFIPYFIWIYLNVLFNNLAQDTIPVFLMVLCIAGVCIALIWFWDKFHSLTERLSNRGAWLIVGGVLLLYFGLQLFVGSRLAVDPSWDFGGIYRISLERAATGELTVRPDYLTLYPNNKGGAFFLYVFYALVRVLGIPLTGGMPLWTGIGLNCLLINVSILLACAFFLRQGKKAQALTCLIVLTACLGLLLYTPIFYTDTLSIVFPVLLMHLFLNLEKTSSNIRRIVNWILIITVTVIGMSIKLTVLFTFIAYIVYRLATADKGRFVWITAAKMAGAAVLIVVVNLAATMLYDQFIVAESDEEAISYKHWIHMGMMGNGGYNGEAMEIEAEVGVDEALKNQIRSYTSNSYFRFLTNKNVFTWGDGLYFSHVKIVRSPYHPEGRVYRLFIRGDTVRPIWLFYANMFHGILLFFILCSFVRMFRSKSWDLLSVARIAFCGVFMFLMIWETRSRYLVNYIPIFALIAVDGLQYLSQNKKRIQALLKRAIRS